MKVCVAQSKPIKGDVQGNIQDHERLIRLALASGAEFIVFPELSLTGYEPALAKDLQIQLDDVRLDVFQNSCNRYNVCIGVGAPVPIGAGVAIGLIVFQPGQPRTVYTKSYLHPDENAFFVGSGHSSMLFGDGQIALAICFEISVPEHAAAAAADGAKIYIASVAKTIDKTELALQRLSQIAREHRMSVLMANFVGQANGATCGGKSAAWSDTGEQICELDGTHEGVIVLDTNCSSPSIAQLPPQN